MHNERYGHFKMNRSLRNNYMQYENLKSISIFKVKMYQGHQNVPVIGK